ncbi:MAG: GNAT family N-acetyltransferase [Flavobacteriales bacterium]|nr:GNAT family N-acetyltransferase [Flavobacteriales bacterium]MBK6550520.1 GNAT family N-acetyltransferase [Flavobacteriales bacterium]MBK6882923.1 GNAT family N-acetyltransferase [Flavobacteriales bacterium]MBK7101911.1 GNAT family N-acetyltransferase [Flavobacteriales bacterium]MBK7114261.1 GNAT family N-acetyltransferase [Flavobacteriales bacterium]
MSQEEHIELHIVRGMDDPYRTAVELLVEQMYEEEAAMGSLARLVPEGGTMWVRSVVSVPDALGRLVVCVLDGVVVGFARGTTGLLPAHEGGDLLGTITHVFVPVVHRRKGIAKALVNELGKWFHARRVLRTELRVVAGNTGGKDFWKAMGFVVMLHTLYRTDP